MIKKLLILFIVSMLILIVCGKKELVMIFLKNGKLLVVVYGDYKCFYCKELDEKVMLKLCKNYIDNYKVEY